MKILLHIGKNPSKVSCRRTGVVCSKYICRFSYFYCYSNLKAVFPALWHKLFIQIWTLFSWKLVIRSQIRSPSLSYKHTMPESLSSESDKYKIKKTSKIPFSQLFRELGTIWKYSHFFLNFEKLRSPARATFKNPKICL